MSYYIFFMLIAVCVESNYACPEFAEHRPDYKHIPGTQAFYKLHRTKATWHDAKATCEREGTTLFYPENESEANTVMTFWQKTEPEEYSYWIFVGMKKSGHTFKTINGTDISKVFHNWLQGEPNNQGGDENCVELFREVVPHIKWLINDAPCTLKFTFVCKSPEIPRSYDEVTDEPNPVEEPKEYKLIPGTDSLYSIHDAVKTWDDAKKTCENEGASLFYPETNSEADAVIAYFSKQDTSFRTTFFYLGLKRSGSLLKLINGTTITRKEATISWEDGEPDFEIEEADCVIMLDNVCSIWACEEEEAFICKKSKPVPSVPTVPERPVRLLNQACGMNNTHYKYSEAVGKCYRIGITPKIWAEAGDVCISEGSDLAVINSHQEANYLVEQISKTLMLRIPGTFVRGVVHLGFHNNHVEDWQTIDGASLYYSGYACWGSLQPDEDKCGSMLYNGHLNAIACNQKAIFVCEHTSPDYIIEPPSGDILRQSLACF